MIYNYSIVGDFQKAEITVKNVLSQFKNNIPVYATSLGFLTVLLSMDRKIDEADKCYHQGLSLIEGPGYETLRLWLDCTRAFYLCATGEFEEAISLVEKSREQSKKPEGHPIFFSIDHILSWANYSLGNFENGRNIAVSSINLAKSQGIKDFNNAWLNIYACLNSSELHLYSEAEKFGKAGLKGFARCESAWGQSAASHALSIVEYRAGNLAEAESHARTALKQISKSNCNTFAYVGIVKINLAMVLTEKKPTPDIEVLFDEAEKDLMSFKFYMFTLNVRRAKYFWKLNQISASEDSLEKALKFCGESRYVLWLTREKDWIVNLLLSLYSQKRMSEQIEHIVLKLGLSIINQLLQIIKKFKKDDKKTALEFFKKIQSEMPKQLRINCFGQFQVFIGDMEIHENLWTSKNAKTLLKYLVLHRSSGYKTKECLQELLWPNEDPEITNNRFHVALSSLRKMLEPSLPPRAESTFICRKGDSYRLNLGFQGWVDIEAFNTEIEKALKETNSTKAFEYYLTAESLYKGDLFLDEPYAEWCQDEKELFKQSYCESANAIIDNYAKIMDFPNVTTFSSKLIRIDPYNEQGYQHLLKLYAQIGNNVMLVKTFEKCRKRIEEELDSPLSQETMDIYRSLLKHELSTN